MSENVFISKSEKHKEAPWGEMHTYFENKTPREIQSWVKILNIKKGESISLQYHKYRTEKWYVLKGNPTAIIGKTKRHLNQGAFVSISSNVNHRLIAESEDAIVLEICFGTQVDEKDIVRLEDRYGRC